MRCSTTFHFRLRTSVARFAADAKTASALRSIDTDAANKLASLEDMLKNVPRLVSLAACRSFADFCFLHVQSTDNMPTKRKTDKAKAGERG